MRPSTSQTNILYANNIYDVIVGKSDHNKDFLHDLYKVVNRSTGVTEVEVSMLYRAIDFANELLKAYNAVLSGNLDDLSIGVEDLDDFNPDDGSLPN
jgi:hypothetical protein